MNDQVKQFYAQYHDHITDKRYNSPYPLRRYIHRQIYDTTLGYIQPGHTVLDAGCGEGVLSMLMAQKGALVTAVDFSVPNVKAAKVLSRQTLQENYPSFCVADAEVMPFPDNSFDVVVSSHVLEHLPDFEQGLREIRRVTSHKAIISLPTCLNPCAWSLLGGDVYWKLTRRSIYGLLVGLSRVLWAYITSGEGVNEGYAGRTSLPHMFRFPRVMRRQIEAVGFEITDFVAGTLAFPYLAQYIPRTLAWIKKLDERKAWAGWRDWGIGSTAVVVKG